MNRMEQGIASIPRQTVIREQPHMLAYITPAEAMLLKQNGGSGLPSHGGVPEFGAVGDFFGAMKDDFMIGTGMKDDPGLNDKGAVIGPFSETSYQKRHRENLARQDKAAEYDALYKEDDKPQPVQFAHPMYQAPMPASFAPPTMAPISSGQPVRLPQIAEQLAGTQAVPATGMATGFTPSNFSKPQNKAYTFQELLGMYQNPYA